MLLLFFACVERRGRRNTVLDRARRDFTCSRGRGNGGGTDVVPRSADASRARVLLHESCEALCPLRGATRARGHKNCMNGSVGVVTKATRVATLRLYAEGCVFCYFPLLLSCSQHSQDSHARSRTAPQTRRAPPGTQMTTSRLQTRDGLTGVEVSTAPGPPRRRRDSWRRIDKGPTGPGPPRGRSKHIYVHGLRSSAPVTATATATASPSAPPTSAAPPRRAAGSPTIRAAAGGPRCSAAAGRRNSRRSHNHNRPTTAGTSPPAARRVPSPTSAGAASGPTRPGGWRSAGTGTSRAAAGSRSHPGSCPSRNQSTRVSQQQLATAAAAFQNARSFFEAAPRPRPPKTLPVSPPRAGSAPFLVSTTSRARRAARRRPGQIFVEEAAGSGPGGCRSSDPPY